MWIKRLYYRWRRLPRIECRERVYANVKPGTAIEVHGRCLKASIVRGWNLND